jgi:hypothetical protein
MSNEETHIDHAAYQAICRRRSEAQLAYAIKDAAEAMEAMPDGHKAGYYADEIHYCVAEMERRGR